MNSDHTNLNPEMHRANVSNAKGGGHAQRCTSYEINRTFTFAQVEQVVKIT
jgi:hypothetical protein